MSFKIKVLLLALFQAIVFAQTKPAVVAPFTVDGTVAV